ncbi:unnamed protein product, partial [Effrenium voratum]
GSHAGQWGDFDERGVPHANVKGKKLTKKEKELVETEYMSAKKRCQHQLKAWEEWELRLNKAEKELGKRDRVRWAYRASGPSKHATLHIDELEDFVAKMGWEPLSPADLASFQERTA